MSVKPSKKRKLVLGRGLGALLPDPEIKNNNNNRDESYFLCSTDNIQANRYQPRRQFDENELIELSQSIKEQGIIQPLAVRPHGDIYELVAGERRLRAAKIAGLDEVPVIVHDISDTALLEMSIVENVQREDLNPIEEADAYFQLMEKFDYTQVQVAEKVGKSRSAVANFLRLRQLPTHIKDSVIEKLIDMGHARALLGIENSALMDSVWKEIVAKNLSVRETEALIKRLKNKPQSDSPKPEGTEEIYYASLGEDLSRHFGTKVQIKHLGKKGKVELEFYSDDDLNRLLNLLR